MFSPNMFVCRILYDIAGNLEIGVCVLEVVRNHLPFCNARCRQRGSDAAIRPPTRYCTLASRTQGQERSRLGGGFIAVETEVSVFLE
jgi:hypothetical protein